ncbi:MAG: hypothetical protein R2717_09130 [Schumannella sp.]
MAGVEATERFAVSAATVQSSVAVIQIIVYAVLQIPGSGPGDRASELSASSSRAPPHR